MDSELRKFLESLLNSGEEEKRKIIEDIQQLEMEQQALKELNAMLDPKRGRKSFRITWKHPYQRPVQNSLISRKPAQIDPSLKDDKLLKKDIPESLEELSSSSGKRSHNKEGPNIDKESTIIKIQANRDSHFSVSINGPLSIIWRKPNRCFVLRCPFNLI